MLGVNVATEFLLYLLSGENAEAHASPVGLRMAKEATVARAITRSSSQRNINKIRGVQNTTHAPATIFRSIT